MSRKTKQNDLPDEWKPGLGTMALKIAWDVLPDLPFEGEGLFVVAVLALAAFVFAAIKFLMQLLSGGGTPPGR